MSVNLKKYNVLKRENKKAMLRLGRNLRDQLGFISEVLKEDLEFLQKYKAQYGDIKYRPQVGQNEDGTPVLANQPTDTFLPIAAEKYKNTIKTLLDSIKMIEKELAPTEEDDLGDESSDEDTESVEQGQKTEDFNAEKWLSDTKKKKK